jgi:hypothetical protein
VSVFSRIARRLLKKCPQNPACLLAKLFALTAALSTTGTLTAADPNIIYGCKANFGGSVRIVNQPGSCTFLETAVQWSVTGHQGPQGPRGEQGPPADPTFSPVIHASAGGSGANPNPLPTSSTSLVPIAHFDLPAGNCLVTAKVQVAANWHGPSDTFFAAYCELNGAASTTLISGLSPASPAAGSLHMELPISGPVSGIPVSCTDNTEQGGGYTTGVWFGLQVVAVRVGDVTALNLYTP